MFRDPAPFRALFPQSDHQPAVIGTVHLHALPGAPAYEGDLTSLIDAALADAHAYHDGGCDALIIENFYDAPFFKHQVGPETVAAMTTIATRIRQQINLPIGINVLRNDAISALAIATVCDCQFIRVNQLAWATLADQGIIEGQAAHVLRYRRHLGSGVLIFADCQTKHAAPLAPQTMQAIAEDTWERAGANALIISGTGTGKPTSTDDIQAARDGAPDAPLLIGSGATPDTLPHLASLVDGFIVGTYFKRDGRLHNPVDVERVRAFIAARQRARPR